MAKLGRPPGLTNKEHYITVGKYAINAPLFFSKMIRDENGCDVWQGGKHTQGYGMFNLYLPSTRQRTMSVTHRIAMMLHLGRELTRDEYIIHEHCDNPLCCNVEHLVLGDAVHRSTVQYAKGHKPVRPKEGNAIKKQNRKYKFTDEEMLFIRDMPTGDSSKRFNLPKTTIGALKHRFKLGYKWLGK